MNAFNLWCSTFNFNNQTIVWEMISNWCSNQSEEISVSCVYYLYMNNSSMLTFLFLSADWTRIGWSGQSSECPAEAHICGSRALLCMPITLLPDLEITQMAMWSRPFLPGTPSQRYILRNFLGGALFELHCASSICLVRGLAGRCHLAQPFQFQFCR